MRKLFCLSLLFVCSQSCSAIVDGTLDDKKTTNTEELTVQVQIDQTELTPADDLELRIMVSDNFTLVPPGDTEAPEPAGYYRIFLDKTELHEFEDWQEVKVIPLPTLFATWKGEPFGEHELTIALVRYDGSAFDGAPSDTVQFTVEEERPLCRPQDSCDLCTILGPEDCRDECLTRTCENNKKEPCIQIAKLSTVELRPETTISIAVKVNRPLAHPDEPGPAPTHRIEPYIEHPSLNKRVKLEPFFDTSTTITVPSMIGRNFPIELPNDPTIRATLKVELVDNVEGLKVSASCWPVILILDQPMGDSDSPP